MPLVVTGTVSIDSVYLPDGDHREGVLGGSCTYFAAAASFYAPVRMVAAIGGDFPPEHMDLLTQFSNIDISGLETRPDSKSFRWGGKYLDNMDHRETLFTHLGVLEEHPPKIPESFRDSRYVFLANTHPAVQRELLSAFPNPTLAVADTMDLWIDTARPELEALLGEVDGLVLNYDEAEMLTGNKNPVAAARHILEFGPAFVIVKKGEHGCLFIHREGIGALPAYPAETVIDPTGAGDSFAGGLMGSIARYVDETGADPTAFETIQQGLAHGTVIASFNIESFSLDRLASLRDEHLQARHDLYCRMVRL